MNTEEITQEEKDEVPQTNFYRIGFARNGELTVFLPGQHEFVDEHRFINDKFYRTLEDAELARLAEKVYHGLFIGTEERCRIAGYLRGVR